MNEEERIREEIARTLAEGDGWNWDMMAETEELAGSDEIGRDSYYKITDQILSIKGIYTEKDIKEAEQRGAQKVVDWIKTRKSTLKVNGYPLLKNAYVIGETDLQAFLKEVEK